MKKKEISYECIKEVTKALRKNFKGIQSNSYGYCCNSDYDCYHKYINDNDYVCAKIFKGGLNNQYYDGKFELYKEVYFSWCLTEFKLVDIIKVMQDVCNKYNYMVETPKDISKCIVIKFKED